MVPRLTKQFSCCVSILDWRMVHLIPHDGSQDGRTLPYKRRGWLGIHSSLFRRSPFASLQCHPRFFARLELSSFLPRDPRLARAPAGHEISRLGSGLGLVLTSGTAAPHACMFKAKKAYGVYSRAMKSIPRVSLRS